MSDLYCSDCHKPAQFLVTKQRRDNQGQLVPVALCGGCFDAEQDIRPVKQQSDIDRYVAQMSGEVLRPV